jgi:hypothetical protein
LKHLLVEKWGRYVVETMEQLSPLYWHLSLNLLHDPELLALADLVADHQPMPITFYSVVNALLYADPDHKLAWFYPTLTATPAPAEDAYPHFRAFCVEKKAQLEALLPTARQQTNEVARCAHLLPAFHLVSERGSGKPLSLIELGTSAGLLLNWDRYRYQYEDQQGGCRVVGDSEALVQVSTRVNGRYPPVPETLPLVAQKVGIDLFPFDIRTRQDVLRLQGNIWPEETERFVLLTRAIAVAKAAPPFLLAGDACDHLPALLHTISAQHTPCIFHSYALRQGPLALYAQIQELMREASRDQERPCYEISLEIDQRHWSRPRLELFTYQHGAMVHQEWLADCAVHGEAMTWREEGVA